MGVRWAIALFCIQTFKNLLGKQFLDFCMSWNGFNEYLLIDLLGLVESRF